MKKRDWFLFIMVALFTFGLCANSWAVHQITTWKDNKAGALTFTFDDGYNSQASFALPALSQRGFKGTQFLISGWPDWNLWNSAASMGHEIASHTVTHAHLTQITLDQARSEIADSQTQINANIPGQKCQTFAYPYVEFNDAIKTIAGQYYIGARGGDVCKLNDPSTVDFYNVEACFGELSPTDTVAGMKAMTDQAITQKKWLVAGFHSFDPNEYGHWTTTDFLAYLDYLKGKNIWIAPFRSVIKYIRERGAASLYVVSETSDKIVLRLTASGLDNSIFDEPLTIRSTVPASWTKVNFQQGSTTQTISSVVEGSDHVVYYSAVLGSSNITLTPCAAPPPSCDTISPGYRSWSLFLDPRTYAVFNFANTKILPSQAYTAYLPQDKSWPGWVNGMNCQHTYAVRLPSMTGNRFPSVPGLNPMTGVSGVLVFTSYSDLTLGANWWLDPKVLAKIDAVAAFIPGVGVFGVWEK